MRVASNYATATTAAALPMTNAGAAGQTVGF